MGAEVFHADGQTRRSYYSLFSVFQKRLKYILHSIHFPLRFGGLNIAQRNNRVTPQMLHHAHIHNWQVKMQYCRNNEYQECGYVARDAVWFDTYLLNRRRSHTIFSTSQILLISS